jgi:hypothetical protein
MMPSDFCLQFLRVFEQFRAERYRDAIGKWTLSAAALLVLCGCASHVVVVRPADPKEQHVLAEAQRFADLLGVHVKAVITTTVYMVPASNPYYPGEKVPAGGWYGNGSIKFWRPVILERPLEYGTALAAHEVAHVIFRSEHDANACGQLLIAGQTCPRN